MTLPSRHAASRWRVKVAQTLFRNFRMLDPERDAIVDGFELLVEDDRIREVSDRPIKADAATVAACGGRPLMPGLIDSPVHVVLPQGVLARAPNGGIRKAAG